MRCKLTRAALAARHSNFGWGRTLGIFIAGTAFCLILLHLPFIRHHTFPPLALALSWLLTHLLHILGQPVYQLGTLIIGPAVNLEITPACTGLYQISFLWIAIFSWPAGFKERFTAFISGTLFLIILNIFRIISIYYGALVFPSWIPFFHDIFWEVIMILTVPFIWLIWITYLAAPVTREEELAVKNFR